MGSAAVNTFIHILYVEELLNTVDTDLTQSFLISTCYPPENQQFKIFNA